MKNLIGIILVISTAFIGCQKDNEAAPAGVEIRIENSSVYIYENVIVNGLAYGDISAGESSTYAEHQLAYSYGDVDITIDGKLYELIPVDYIGETPLNIGKYTYIIGADSTNDRFGRLSHQFRKD